MWKTVIPGIHDLCNLGGQKAIQPVCPKGFASDGIVSEPLCSREGMNVHDTEKEVLVST